MSSLGNFWAPVAMTNHAVSIDDGLSSRQEAGAWLAAARKQSGMSQRELAAALGDMYHTFISQIESGKGKLPSERYEAYAKALGLNPQKFAKTMLRFYEPSTYQLLFGGNAA
jgi:Predicted transcriptional regulators